MKHLCIIIIMFHSLNLLGQVDKPNRDDFSFTLAVDSVNYFVKNIESSPYFVDDNVLQIFPSEKVFVELEITTDTISSMKVVSENVNPSKTITFEFQQEINKEEGSSFMMLKIKNPFQRELSYDAHIFILADQQWVKTSVLPIHPNISGYEIWNDVIASIIIDNLVLKSRKSITYDTSSDIVQPSPNDAKVKAFEWVKRNNIELNKLPLAVPEEINYTCDSSLYLKQIRGDTVIYWAYGWQIPIDTTKASDWITGVDYGKTAYLKDVTWDGRLTSVSLEPYTFYFKNDSIFELQQRYQISHDSLIRLLDLYYLTPNKDSVPYYENLIEINSYKQFKLIYHPSIFVDGSYDGNNYKDAITLVDEWICNNKKYFALEIANYWSGEKRKYTLVFDEDYKCLEYEGCDQIGIDCMSKRNF